MSTEPENTNTTHEELIVSSMTLSTGGFQIPGYEPTHAVTLDVTVIGDDVPEGETRTLKLFLELDAAAELASVFPDHVASAQAQAKTIIPLSAED